MEVRDGRRSTGGACNLASAGAARIGITPDGSRAFVPDYDRSQPGVPSRVSVVDLADLSVVATPVVCSGPHHAEVDPAGDLVAVACSLSDEIVLLDAWTLEERGRFAAGPEAGPPGQPVLKPLNLAWSPDGEVIWVGLHLAGTVRAFRPNGEIVGTVAVGSRPAQIAITPDGAYAGDGESGRCVSVYGGHELADRDGEDSVGSGTPARHRTGRTGPAGVRVL